jgi:hypothetical protein
MCWRAADALRRYAREPYPQSGDGPFVIPGANALDQRLVRAEGLEPPQLSSLEPKSSASTSSATPAEKALGPAAMLGAAAYNMSPSVRSKKMLLMGQAHNMAQRLDIEG